MGSPAIFNGNFVKFLKDNLKFSTGMNFFTYNGSIDPTVTPTEGNIGDLFLTTVGLYRKADAGVTTNWGTVLTGNTEVSRTSVSSTIGTPATALPSGYVIYDVQGDDNTPLSNNGFDLGGFFYVNNRLSGGLEVTITGASYHGQASYIIPNGQCALFVQIDDGGSREYRVFTTETPSVFAEDTDGLVPGPDAAEIVANKILQADSTWVAQSGITTLTGDITATGPGSVAATIANDAITFAKIQNITTNKLLGRATAGSGDMEEITLGTNLSYTGTTLNVAGGGTTVQVAYLKDIKAFNTNGGTFTSGSWQTRDLNDEVDTPGIVTLSANQFTLAAGTYDIEAKCPAYRVDRHFSKLYNITDAADVIIGSAEYSGSGVGTNVGTSSFIAGQIIIAGTKTFEIRHYSESTGTTTGFGVNTNLSGTSSTYTTVKITKRS